MIGLLRGLVLAWLAVGLVACMTEADRPANRTVNTQLFNDQAMAQIRQGQARKEQVRATLGDASQVNYRSGTEVWIYQGLASAAASSQRTVTVQFDERGLVRNVGVQDLPLAPR